MASYLAHNHFSHNGLAIKLGTRNKAAIVNHFPNAEHSYYSISSNEHVHIFIFYSIRNMEPPLVAQYNWNGL